MYEHDRTFRKSTPFGVLAVNYFVVHIRHRRKIVKGSDDAMLHWASAEILISLAKRNIRNMRGLCGRTALTSISASTPEQIYITAKPDEPKIIQTTGQPERKTVGASQTAN